MRIGIIVPDRGDRPQFMQHCSKMIEAQTIKEDCQLALFIVDAPPANKDCDITKRYREGYDFFRGKEADLLAFMENDDWYSPIYLETMVKEWIRAGQPALFGTSYTIYYHIKLFAHFTMQHSIRSSAMSTLIKPDMLFDWCPDNDPYTDNHLWTVALKQHRKVFNPIDVICMGIKHGIGLCGGGSHTEDLHRYTNKDENKSFLKRTVDAESFEFYNSIF